MFEAQPTMLFHIFNENKATPHNLSSLENYGDLFITHKLLNDGELWDPE